MGNRFLELLGTCDLDVYLLNTGRVGGGDDDERSKKVSISTSAAVQDGIIDGAIEWVTDPDFGYEVVDVESSKNAALLEKVPAEVLQPHRLFDRTGRSAEYQAWVARMKQERKSYLEKFAVAPEIVRAVVNQ